MSGWTGPRILLTVFGLWAYTMWLVGLSEVSHQGSRPGVMFLLATGLCGALCLVVLGLGRHLLAMAALPWAVWVLAAAFRGVWRETWRFVPRKVQMFQDLFKLCDSPALVSLNVILLSLVPVLAVLLFLRVRPVEALRARGLVAVLAGVVVVTSVILPFFDSQPFRVSSGRTGRPMRASTR
ncbi:MAG: hypothetical protein HY815_27025 [Candidatus Riflebacteria bacterium]|nr:hypothetical protein [Candidatus Riflebacteria bacterium]